MHSRAISTIARLSSLYENGKMYDLTSLVKGLSPGYSLSDALAINNMGQILARAYSSGNWQDVLLTPTNLPEPPAPPPIPEPSTTALLGVTIAAASVRKLLRIRKPRD